MPPEHAALFEQIQQQHLGIIWKTANAFALSKEDREDLFQEITLALWQALPQFEARSKLSTYVYRVAHRRALNWKRSLRRYQHRLARFEHEPLSENPASDPRETERLEWLYRAINTLSPVERTLCLLYLDGLSYREMAEVLGLTEDNIGIRVHRCKQKLTTLLDHSHEQL